MADTSERTITDDTGKEILEAIRNIPGVIGANPIDHGGTGATTAEQALKNLGAQPLIGVDVEEELGKAVKSVNGITPDPSGDVAVVHVRTAENLTSDDAQDIYGDFIERTTGGSASLTDGKSWIGILEGNSVRDGYVPEQRSIQVNNVPREPITASINWASFKTAVDDNPANLTFSHNGSAWSSNPAAYGITVNGFPVNGDSMIVAYSPKAETYTVNSTNTLTVTMNWTTFETKYASDSVDTFIYTSGAWSENLAEYGISVTGTPTEGDVINVYYSPESRGLYVNPAVRGAALIGYVNWDTFRAAVSYESVIKTFTYTTEWSESLTSYGISVSGTPIRGDSITVYFTEEIRGHITNATPTRFVSTGWNLYDHTLGYARVLKYSDTYGFKIGGTYTSAVFAETLNGSTQALAIDSNGNFSIPSDGYVLVTGGNGTSTRIYMTWSDWIEGHAGLFEPYMESAIDISSLMSTNFPNGLCAVGSTADDIDFSNKIANVRIERMPYSVSNLVITKSSGRDFTYDEDYIYAVRETPISIGFSIDYELDAYDHGLERVEGTSIPVFIHMLYGQNLRDKLRTDVVTLSRQTLSNAQKQQVRENLGLGGYAQLPVENGGTGANTASGARTSLGLGNAAVKNLASAINNSDTGLPTAAMVSQAISPLQKEFPVQAWGTTLTVDSKKGHVLFAINADILVLVWLANVSYISVLAVTSAGHVYTKSDESGNATLKIGRLPTDETITITRSGRSITITTTNTSTITPFGFSS